MRSRSPVSTPGPGRPGPTTTTTTPGPPGPPGTPARPARRVRHQARDAVLLMAFSAGTSVGLAALMLLVLEAGR